MTPFERLRQLLSGRRPAFMPPKQRYPNTPAWSAMLDGAEVEAGDGEGKIRLSVVPCGALVMPTGRLAACDPYVGLRREGMPTLDIKPGRYDVFVTLADVSTDLDGSHMREAYATLVVDPSAREVRRWIITPIGDDTPCEAEIGDDGTFAGFPVDAGTACFADAGAIRDCMPPGEETWNDTLFDNESPHSWFARMDDETHLRAGLANIPLPLARNGENIVIFHSGWGDGLYPVVGGYDSAGKLVRVHIDFLVLHDSED